MKVLLEFTKEGVKQKLPSEQQYYEWKRLIDQRGLTSMAWLVRADRKSTLTQISLFIYVCDRGEQKINTRYKMSKFGWSKAQIPLLSSQE